MIEFGHGTHCGLRRRYNEDTYYADPVLGLFLVADGMGGYARGDRAAAAARDSVVGDIANGLALAEAVHGASAKVTATQSPRSPHAPPTGTTLAALRVHGSRFELAWIGDSRIYLWHRQWWPLTRDGTDLQSLIARQLLDAEQAPPEDDEGATAPMPRRGIATQALGVTPADRLHVQRLAGRLESGMRFLICSDGLGEALHDQQLADIVCRDDIGAQECVDQLIRAALNAGGRDNISAVLARFSQY